MSKYTTEVRFICETNANLKENQGYNSVNEIVSKARTKIFDFDYPIFDENYRSVLETKILKHFYTREIGSETVGLWKLWLDTRMNEIMPYYNDLYKSALIEFNPMYDTDIKTERNVKDNGNKNDINKTNTDRKDTGTTKFDGLNIVDGTNKTDGNRWEYYSDTPQGGLNGIAEHTYLTNATNNTIDDTLKIDNITTNDNTTTLNNNSNQETNSNTNSVYSNVEEYVEHVYGKRGYISYSKMLLEFRDTLINIDLKVIHELDDLFFNLW